jgi:hypothetical protein
MKTLVILIKISVFIVLFATSRDAANAKTKQEILVISTGLTYETGQYSRKPWVQVIFVSPVCYMKGVDASLGGAAVFPSGSMIFKRAKVKK